MEFTEALANKINASSIADITAYAESFPAPKDIAPQLVCAISAGYLPNTGNRDIENYTIRFLVSGSAASCISKATEILELFVPAGAPNTEHLIDGMSGATLTGNGVSDLVRYWTGPHGFGPYLKNFREAG